jgi:hypothetical protein
MLIDCETCAVRGIGCSDCVISVFLATPSNQDDGWDEGEPPVVDVGTIDLDDAERRAVATLAAGGLIPPLRLRAIS